MQIEGGSLCYRDESLQFHLGHFLRKFKVLSLVFLVVSGAVD